MPRQLRVSHSFTPPSKEKDIQKSILSYLSIMKIAHSATNADRAWGKGGGVRQSKVSKGWPDISAVLPVYIGGELHGVAFFIECKTEKGSIKPYQKDQLRELSENGAICVVARSVKDVQRVVDQFYKKPMSKGALKATNRILELEFSDKRDKSLRDELVYLQNENNNPNTTIIMNIVTKDEM